MALRVKLLGNPSIRDGETMLKLPSRRALVGLLGFLLLRRGQTFSRTHVAFTLWPDEEEEAARAELRRYLYQLRKALPAECEERPWLLVDDDSVTWNADAPCELDIEEFERLCDDPARLGEAVALYDGDLLPEIYEDWAIAARERLRERYFAALAELVVQYRSRRAFAGALSFAQRLLGADPWREHTVRSIMTIRYESGDAAGALAVYERFATALRSEMGVEPMAETIALRETIVRGESLDAPPADDDSEAASRPEFSVPFVGRNDEFGALRAQWQRAARGRGSLALIEGEPGIGKTRLAAELALLAESEGGRVIGGGTGSPERRPYESLVDALRSAVSLVAALRLPAPPLAAVAELVAELRVRRPDLPTVERLAGDAERARLFDALGQVLVSLARPRPLLIVLEDLHWAGAVTIDALTYLAQRIEGAAVLIVLTARNNEPGRRALFMSLQRTLRGTPVLTRVPLGPLSRAATTALVDATLPAKGPGPGLSREELTDAAFGRSEGNPLFLVEMLREAAVGDAAQFVVPSSVRAVVADRAARLEPETLAIAEIASIGGMAFDIDLVCDVAGLREADVLTAIDALLDGHLIRESTPRSRYDYAFTHHLIHAAIYDAIAPDVRARRHRRLARALEANRDADAGDRDAEIALHHDRAGDSTAAARFYAYAARRAERQYANLEALELVERGLTLHTEPGALRFDLLLIRIDLAMRLGTSPGLSDDLADLSDLANGLDDEARFTVLKRAFEFAYKRDDRIGELRALEALERRGEELADDRWLAAAFEARAQHAIALYAASEGLAYAEKAERRYAVTGDQNGRVRALAAASVASADCGNPDEAMRFADRAHEIAFADGDALSRLLALRMQGHAAQVRQDYERFARVALETLELCRAAGDRAAEAHASFQLGNALWALWRVDEGLAQMRASVALFETIGSQRIVASLNNLGGFLIDLGDFDESRAVLERAERIGSATDRNDVANHIAANLVEAAWLTGDLRGMGTYVERARRQAAHVLLPRHVAIARLAESRFLRCELDFAGSLQALDEAANHFAALKRASDIVDVTCERGLTLLAAGRHPEARAAIEDSIALARGRAMASQYPIRHKWIAACVYAADGGASAAAAALEEAYRIYAERHAALTDERLRATYASIGYHRAIVRARERGIWPPFDRCVVACAMAERVGVS